MILDKKLFRKLDEMLDEAIAGTFQVKTYDESQLSKIEAKMMRFLELSRLKQEQIESERGRVRSLIGDISYQKASSCLSPPAVSARRWAE